MKCFSLLLVIYFLSVVIVNAQPAKKIQIKLQLNGLETIMEGSDSEYINPPKFPIYHNFFDSLTFKIKKNELDFDTSMLETILECLRAPLSYDHSDTICFADFAQIDPKLDSLGKFNIKDLNNDGFMDIFITEGEQSKYTEYGRDYDVFLFNPKQKKFLLYDNFLKGQDMIGFSKSGKYIVTRDWGPKNGKSKKITWQRLYRNVVRKNILVPIDSINVLNKKEDTYLRWLLKE